MMAPVPTSEQYASFCLAPECLMLYTFPVPPRQLKPLSFFYCELSSHPGTPEKERMESMLGTVPSVKRTCPDNGRRSICSAFSHLRTFKDLTGNKKFTG